jgi:hypothetical protein
MGWTYKKWYTENKERLLSERKEKYHSDPEYRRRRIREASESYYRRRQEPKEIADRRLIQTTSGGEFFSIGKVSDLIGKKIQTIREYHRNGVIPQPQYSNTRGWRLYSRRQAELLMRVFSAFDDKDDDSVTSLSHVSVLVRKEWKDGKEEGGQDSGGRGKHHRKSDGVGAYNV